VGQQQEAVPQQLAAADAIERRRDVKELRRRRSGPTGAGAARLVISLTR